MSNVIRLGLYRAVFILPENVGATVVMATHRKGRAPGMAHERKIESATEARHYAAELASQYDCRVVGSSICAGSEDAA